MTIKQAQTADLQELKREALLLWALGDNTAKAKGFKLWEIYLQRTNG